MSIKHCRNWEDSVQVDYILCIFYMSSPVFGSCLPQSV